MSKPKISEPQKTEPNASGSPTSDLTALEQYRCPGSSYTIGHAVHLGRLSENDPMCRECPYRHHTGSLSPQRQAHIAESLNSTSRDVVYTEEYLHGTIHNQMDEQTVRRAAFALGILIQQQIAINSVAKIALATDRPQFTALLTSAACDGLKQAGCMVWDFGTASVGSFMTSMIQQASDGGLMIGNPSGNDSTVGLSFWSQCGKPISRDSGLEEIETLQHKPAARPVRRGGDWQRGTTSEQYLTDLQSYFHALRPLRVVYHSACEALTQNLQQLAQNVACEFIIPARLQSQANDISNSKKIKQRIIHSIIEEEAHFGVSINGDGDVIEFFRSTR